MSWRLVSVASWLAGLYTIGRVGVAHAALFTFAQGTRHAPWGWPNLRLSLWYTLGVLFILAAHEGGHWWRAWTYRVPVVGPFLFPVPLGWSVPLFQAIGTAGACLWLRPLGRLTALERFDIAWAGLMLGAVATLLCTALGVWWSVPLAHAGLPARMWTPWPIRAFLPGPTAWHPLLFAARVGWIVTTIGCVTDGVVLWATSVDVWSVRRWHVVACGGLCCGAVASL